MTASVNSTLANTGGGFDPASVAITGGTITGITSLSMSGHILFGSDNAFDIGASGSGRPRNIFTTSNVQFAKGVNLPAGGSSSASMVLSVSLIGVYVGSGVPTVSAPQGSIYLRSDGSSSSTRAYINTDGATTWTAVTTAA